MPITNRTEAHTVRYWHRCIKGAGGRPSLTIDIDLAKRELLWENSRFCDTCGEALPQSLIEADAALAKYGAPPHTGVGGT